MVLKIAAGVILGIFGVVAVVAIFQFTAAIIGAMAENWSEYMSNLKRRKREAAVIKWRKEHGLEP